MDRGGVARECGLGRATHGLAHAVLGQPLDPEALVLFAGLSAATLNAAGDSVLYGVRVAIEDAVDAYRRFDRQDTGKMVIYLEEMERHGVARPPVPPLDLLQGRLCFLGLLLSEDCTMPFPHLQVSEARPGPPGDPGPHRLIPERGREPPHFQAGPPLRQVGGPPPHHPPFIIGIRPEKA